MSGRQVLVDAEALGGLLAFMTFRHYCSFCGVPTKGILAPDQKHKEGCPAPELFRALTQPKPSSAGEDGAMSLEVTKEMSDLFRVAPGIRSVTCLRKTLPASWGGVVVWDEVDGVITTNPMIAVSVHRRALAAAQPPQPAPEREAETKEERIMKLYAVKVSKIEVPEGADTQTKGIASALEQQRHSHVYLGRTWGEAEGRLRDALAHIRELQLVTGPWEVEVAGQDIREDMRLTSAYFVGEHEKIIFPTTQPE